jgi:hypothetical protein
MLRRSNDLLYVGYATTLLQLTPFGYSDVETEFRKKLKRRLFELKRWQILRLFTDGM